MPKTNSIGGLKIPGPASLSFRELESGAELPSGLKKFAGGYASFAKLDLLDGNPLVGAGHQRGRPLEVADGPRRRVASDPGSRGFHDAEFPLPAFAPGISPRRAKREIVARAHEIHDSGGGPIPG